MLDTCPAYDFSVHLHPLPVDLHIKYAVACSAVRLRESGCPPSNFLEEVPQELPAFPPDHAIRMLISSSRGSLLLTLKSGPIGRPAMCCMVMTQYSLLTGQRWSVKEVLLRKSTTGPRNIDYDK